MTGNTRVPFHGERLGAGTLDSAQHSCNRARVARLLPSPCSRAKKLTECQRGGEGFHQPRTKLKAIPRIPNNRISDKCVFIFKIYLSTVSNERIFQKHETLLQAV